MMEHTKGPWRYEQETKTIRSVPANYWLATMDSWDGAVNHEANAHLIAAAPDLLNSLKQCVDSLDHWFKRYGDSEGCNSKMMMEAKQAILKAEGKEGER
jgi:hypothetical protein